MSVRYEYNQPQPTLTVTIEGHLNMLNFKKILRYVQQESNRPGFKRLFSIEEIGFINELNQIFEADEENIREQ